jgi:ABC-type uncharacterized transport system substrate-binding protein
MKGPKTYDASYYFDMTFEEGTPEYVIEELLEQAVDNIMNEIRKRKVRDTDVLIQGDLSYNDLVVDENKDDEIGE